MFRALTCPSSGGQIVLSQHLVSSLSVQYSTVCRMRADCWAVRGSNPGGGETFRTRPDRPWGPPSLLYNGYRVFPGGKAAGAWRWPLTPSSAKVKERVQLYLYYPFGPSWPVLGWTLPLPLLTNCTPVIYDMHMVQVSLQLLTFYIIYLQKYFNVFENTKNPRRKKEL